ncbi:MAG: L-threonylcarbamoyladenylate synthase [Oscillospiraceae bacterium]
MDYDTKILDSSDSSVQTAAEYIKQGMVVGMPTETVYGLAANAFDEKAAERIFRAKGRPADNPLIVHIASLDMLEDIAEEVPELAVKCAERFWPGPLTMIMPKSDKIPPATSGGLDTVGIRFPSHKTAQKLIKMSGLPLAAPSANISGSPSPTTAMHVFNDMAGKIPCIIDGGNCSVGVESTVISFENDAIRVLRPGFVSPEDLREITGNIIIDKGVLHMLEGNAKAASPGMKYKHYSPKADVTIIEGSDEQFRDFIRSHSDENIWCMTFSEDDLKGIDVRHISYGKTDEQQARLLFDTLRELDNRGAEKVYARCPHKTEVGLAVYNRLLRAAGFQVIKL